MSPHEHSHSGHAHGARGPHGNPADLAGYIARMEDPSRDEWQRPDEVIAALGLRRGMQVGEIGAGPGYFTLRLGRAVGASGHVFAVEVEPEVLSVLRDRIEASGLRNVSPVLGLPADAFVPRGSCQRILMLNVFHHFPAPAAYLERLATSLAPGGTLAIVDFHDRETPVGPPVELRVSRRQALAHARKAGLRVVRELTFLPHQYFVVLKTGRARTVK